MRSRLRRRIGGYIQPGGAGGDVSHQRGGWSFAGSAVDMRMLAVASQPVRVQRVGIGSEVESFR
jgi:hypothetical protein